MTSQNLGAGQLILNNPWKPTSVTGDHGISADGNDATGALAISSYRLLADSVSLPNRQYFKDINFLSGFTCSSTLVMNNYPSAGNSRYQFQISVDSNIRDLVNQTSGLSLGDANSINNLEKKRNI